MVTGQILFNIMIPLVIFFTEYLHLHIYRTKDISGVPMSLRASYPLVQRKMTVSKNMKVEVDFHNLTCNSYIN